MDPNDYTRDDLDMLAAQEGVENPSALPNKQAVVDAIEAQRAAKAVSDSDEYVTGDDPRAQPAPPAERATDIDDDPEVRYDGRPPLVEVAQDLAANTTVRVIGGEEN